MAFSRPNSSRNRRDSTRSAQPSVYVGKHYDNKRRSIRSLRKLVEYLDQRHSSFSIGILLLHTVMETVSVGFYIWTSQVSRATSVKEFNWNLPVFIVEVVLNIIFFLEWVAVGFLQEDKWAYLMSWLSFVNLTTSVPMIVLGIGSLADSVWRHGWVPMYLRVWWLHDCLVVLLDYKQIAHLTIDIYREVARFLLKLFALIATCVGTHQIVESCCGHYMDLFDSLYCMVVAFATIGFGDVTPLTSPARLFMVGFIIIAICYFVPLFQKLASIGQQRHYYAYVSSRRWFSRKRRHVIVSGLFSDLAVELLLRNFYSGWRKYLDTRIVLMSPEEYSPEVKLTVNLPWFKDRVMLMVGDPAKEQDLRRANAHEADAIFLFGNARSSAYYHDYTIISQCLAVELYDPDLPQHVLLHNSSTLPQVAPYVSSALEVEGRVHSLLGLSLVQPGVIPFFVNLLRTYEPQPLDTTLERNWVELYEFSIRNDVYAIEVPDVLRGREFWMLARAYYDFDVTLIGILNGHDVVQLNPQQLVPNSKKVILIAKTMQTARNATQAISRNYEETFGEEMLEAPDPDARHPVKPTSASEGEHNYLGKRKQRYLASEPAAAEGVWTDSDEVDRIGGSPITSDSATSSGSSQGCRSLVEIENAMEFQNHFVLIELSASKTKDKETRYAQEGEMTAIARDIFNVVRPIYQADPQRHIILLDTDLSFASYFEHLWTSSHLTNPIKVIIGCGLNTADLLRCNLGQCSGCCIFFAGDISRMGSTSAMAMLVDLSITEILHGPPAFPVVIELEGLTNLPLFPPYAEDEQLCSKAEIDFVFEPNFIIGNALSRVMLYPALQRTYFMEEFIDVINVLVDGHSPSAPAVSKMPLRLCAVEVETYNDVVNYCLNMGLLPVALHRVITDQQNPSIEGQRFVLANPPHGLPVYQATDAVFYITPS